MSADESPRKRSLRNAIETKMLTAAITKAENADESDKENENDLIA